MSAARDPLLPPDEVDRRLATRALVATALGPLLWPAALVAPVLAAGALLRVRRDRDRLADPAGAASPARIALVASLVQLAVYAGATGILVRLLIG